MTETSYKVVPLLDEHVPRAVAVHLKAFPGFFLSFLGPSFLAEFYRGFPKDNDALAFVAEDKNAELLGVIVGMTKPNGFFKKLLRRRWWAFSLASMGAVLRRPTIVWRLMQAIRYRGDPLDDQPRALLSSIAVSPLSQNRGVGRALLIAWVEAARLRGCTGCYLSTDAVGNDGVNAFYQRNGWRLQFCSESPQGRLMNRYVRDFSTTSSEGSK